MPVPAIPRVGDDVRRSFVFAPTPRWAADLYGAIGRAAGVPWLPALVWVRDAFGFGGVHAGSYIVIGEVDLGRMAADIYKRRRAHMPAASPRDLLLTVARIIMAHEIGHAFRAQHAAASQGIPEESGADVIAGWIAERLGWAPWLDEWVMDHSGCNGPASACTHPTSATRVHAYREGRRACRVQIAGFARR
jgi:hypothetical protein